MRLFSSLSSASLKKKKPASNALDSSLTHGAVHKIHAAATKQTSVPCTSSDSASRSSSRRPKQPRSRDYEHIASTGGLDSGARGQNQHEPTKKYTERDARI